ncbi:hypothetical protein [Pelotomaculum propionicicum]|uniref:Uncharacterized protein n=1 Tax=Pelotomaculum propionicicum TaxID=258475 RepID=A0A4Y7RJX3_9FIRM|nr:hypothetical protein [Pelotomaculum propionicicum]TEB09143.1 hypothetical protein Pmgp_03364 [Pelotomaculum propionicicum]
MAKDDNKNRLAGTEAQLVQTIESMRNKHQLTAAEFAGLCMSNDWAEGLEIAEEDFLQALVIWRKSPVHGRTK